MNQEDTKRFERYRKGYISKNETEIENKNVNNKIGFIDKIDINKNILINNVIINNKLHNSK